MSRPDSNLIVEREPDLPQTGVIYREIGPFNADEIPAGLFNQHRLSKAVWATLHITAGSIYFAWNDLAGGRRLLASPDVILIPPEVPHHLERIGPVTLSIRFWR